MKMTVNTFLFSGVLPLMVWMVRMCLNCVTYSRIIHLSYFMVWYLLHNSLWLSRAHTSFSIPNAYNFYRFWGILRNNNCHREMITHVFPGHISSSLMFVAAHWVHQSPIFNCSASVHLHFALECSSVFTYLYGAHGCAIPSVMFYQHMCILFMKLSEFLNYLSRFHFHLANESPHCCLLSINVHQY